MSRHVASLVYSRKVGSLLRKAVLAYVADVADHDGSGVWSSKQRIADEIEASRRGVIDCIKSLVDDGILVEVGKRKCANGFTMEYAIDLDVVSSLPIMPHHKGDPCKSAQVQEVHPTRAPSSHDPCTQFTQTVLNRPKPTANAVSPTESKSKRKASPKSSARGCRIPENWNPGPEGYAFASQNGFTPQEINNETAEFCDYWRGVSGQKGVKLDWLATWRNHIRRQSKFRKKQSARPDRPSSIGDVFDQVVDQLEPQAQPGFFGEELHPAHPPVGHTDRSGEATLLDVDGAQLPWNGQPSDRAA